MEINIEGKMIYLSRITRHTAEPMALSSILQVHKKTPQGRYFVDLRGIYDSLASLGRMH